MTIPDGQYISQKDADVIAEYIGIVEAGYCEEERVLEIGTGKGHSAKFISSLLPDGWIIYTIDGYGMYGSEDGRIFDRNKVGENIANTSEYLKDTRNVVKIIADSSKLFWELKVEILFLDGSHDYNSVKKDFYNFEQFVTSNGIVIFHDYWNPEYGVGKFVKELIQKGIWKLLHGHRMAVIQRR